MPNEIHDSNGNYVGYMIIHSDGSMESRGGRGRTVRTGQARSNGVGANAPTGSRQTARGNRESAMQSRYRTQNANQANRGVVR